MWSRSVVRRFGKGRRRWLGAGVVVGALAIPVAANATFPEWLQHIVGASTVES